MAIFHLLPLRCFALTLVVLGLCQCKTTREVKNTRTSFGFDQNVWGGQGGGNDSSEIRSKFAEKGYTIGEDGTIQADRPNLFQGDKAAGVSQVFRTKNARMKQAKAGTKDFRLPEYLNRQQYAGVSQSDYGGQSARENRAKKSRFAQRLFGTESRGSQGLEQFGTASQTASSQQRFVTKSDRAGTAARNNSTLATGTQQVMGYQDNAGLSVDDVKKLLSPGVYGRAKKL